MWSILPLDGEFPGGLGFRKFLAVVLGKIGGFDAAVAALAAVVTRAVMTLSIGAATIAVPMTQPAAHKSGDAPSHGSEVD